MYVDGNVAVLGLDLVAYPLSLLAVCARVASSERLHSVAVDFYAPHHLF